MEQQVRQNQNGDIGSNLNPDHVDIGASPRVLASPGLLDSLPYCQQAKAKHEAHSERRKGLVALLCAGSHVPRLSLRLTAWFRMSMVSLRVSAPGGRLPKMGAMGFL